MLNALFRREGDHFIPGELAASPWGPGVLHGGPPAGLLAHAIEALKPNPELFVSRITIDLFRAIPMAPVTVTTRVVRGGRRIHVVEASLLAGGVEVARASALMLLPNDVQLPPGERWRPESPVAHHDLPATGLGISNARERSPRPGFHTTIEARRAGGAPGSGRHTSWIRIPVPLVEGEEITPLQRAAATADFGNGLSNIQTLDNSGFINADITLYLHRMPLGDWIGMDARSIHQAHGLGMIESRMYDESGPVGVAVQALLANRRA